MFGLGLPEIIIILIVVAVFFFDSDKLLSLAKGLGRFTRDFKKGKEEFGREIIGDDNLSELSRNLGRFSEEFRNGKEEIEIEINKFKKK